jgi:hypothetical protein
MDQPGCWAAHRKGFAQSGESQVAVQPVAGRPADDPAGEQVDDDREVQPTVTGPDTGNIGAPFLVGPGMTWTRNGESSGSIGIDAEQDAIGLHYRTRCYGETEWQDIRQRVPITWTDCALGGWRRWFTCPIYSNGRHSGRRVAKLYDAGDLFACGQCHGLTYQSQQENPAIAPSAECRR